MQPSSILTKRKKPCDFESIKLKKKRTRESERERGEKKQQQLIQRENIASEWQSN